LFPASEGRSEKADLEFAEKEPRRTTCEASLLAALKPDHHLGYFPVTPGTLASGRACIGRLSPSFLAPQTLQTRWSAASGTGMRFGRSRLPASM
jgi:hypothetical protein